MHLRSRLLLLALVEGEQGHTGHLHLLKTAAGNISLRLASLTETGDEDLVVLVNVVEATVSGHEASNLLAVLDQLHSDTLTNGRVRLLGLKTDLLHNNTLGHAGASQGVGLHVTHGVRLVILLTRPSLVSAVTSELATSSETRGLSVRSYVQQGRRIGVSNVVHSSALYRSAHTIAKKLTPFPF